MYDFYNLTIMHRVCHAEWRPGHVLCELACDYLYPVSEEGVNCFRTGTDTLFCIQRHAVSSHRKECLNCSTTAEESPGCATIYLPCGREDSPRHFRPGDRDTILFGVMQIPLAFRDVLCGGSLCDSWAPSQSKHQGYQVMHNLLLSRMLAKATVNLSKYIIIIIIIII